MLQLLSDKGSECFAESLLLLVNEAMQAEGANALQAQPSERTDARLGLANGFKPKTFKTRLGPITSPFRRCAAGSRSTLRLFDKAIRSEQALKLALAEMDVQGLSTRKVATTSGFVIQGGSRLMLSFAGSLKVFVALEPCDMRKGF